jgi:diguanylate cyclase (GGDEF)-like protein
MTLDLKTLMLVATALCLLMAAVIAYVSEGSPPALRALLRHWALALVYQAGGWVLYAERGSIPDVLSVVMANGLLLWAFIEMNRALRRYFGEPYASKRDVLLLLTILGGMTFFLYGWESLTVRIVMATAALTWIAFDSVWVLWRRGPKHWPRTYRVVAFFLLLPTAVLLARAINQAFGEPVQSTLELHPLQMSLHLLATLAPLGGALGFVLMVGTRLQEELRDAANSDPLTGLPNRRRLDELAAPLLRDREQPIAALMVDADHFKAINDRLGHAAGDEALCWLGSHLRVHARATDVIARLGGEEFVLLLPGTDVHAATQLAHRLREAVCEAPLYLAGETIKLTVSIGVAEGRASSEPLHELLSRADEALYRAKAAGRDRVEVAP